MMQSYGYYWQGMGIWNLLVVLVYIALIVVPCAKILGKAGYSGWWALLALIPLINVIALWIFAFSSWPRWPQATTPVA